MLELNSQKIDSNTRIYRYLLIEYKDLIANPLEGIFHRLFAPCFVTSP